MNWLHRLRGAPAQPGEPSVDHPEKDESGLPVDVETPAAEPATIEEPPQAPLATERVGLLSRLTTGLRSSREGLRDQLQRALGRERIDEELWEELEEVLIAADAGVGAATTLVERLREIASERRVADPADLWEVLPEVLADRVLAVADFIPADQPSLILVIGVNGTGKTTTIAKLAHRELSRGRRVLLAAADTYRAAAIEQLEVWGSRLGVELVKHERKSDPSAVIYDAVAAARARKIDVVLADTAGRLHTYSNLMEELAKMRRVAEREFSSVGTVRSLLVVDATTGQNGLLQAKAFQESVGIDGLALTKLDGTAKGGVILAIQELLAVPVAYVGLGEGIDDLEPLDARDFAQALVQNTAS